jgi:hypothetical protein
MNNPNHISKSLETILWVNLRKFFYADPGSGIEKIRIRDEHCLLPVEAVDYIFNYQALVMIEFNY